MAQTIKSLIAPLIMMAGLALLPACWGLKRPSPVTVTIAGICGANPFNAACDETYEIERIVKINECIAGDAAATPTCADAVIARPCLRDPFATACENDPNFTTYVRLARNARATYCVADNADATLCAGVAGSVQFDMDCLDSPTGNPVHASCPTRPSVVRACADDPFTRTGCGNVPTIETLRIAHCEDPLTAWDDGCVEATYTGATVARNMACLEYGIDADAGGHAGCAGRANVLAACGEATPFALPVCDAVGDIGMKRTTFCLKTADNGGANPFNEGCEQDTHGDVNMARDTACLASLSADDGCEARIMQTCTDTPLAGVSCAGLDGHSGFLDAFCAKGNNDMLGGCAMTPARLSACAAGTLGSSECDTDMIAPAVCASSGANANPFVAFCTGTNNIGGGNIAAIRQTVVTLCLNSANASMAVCVNTSTTITDLRTGNTRCELDTHAFTDRCAYTQYETAREGFCPVGDPFAYPGCDNVGIIRGRRITYCNMPINAWKSDCTGGNYGDKPTAQGEACVMFGMGAGGHTSCTTNTYAKNFCGMPSNNPLADANSGCRVLENFAAIVGVYCVANSEIPACKVDSAAWTGSFTTSLATAPATGDTANRFLSGLTGATAVPTTDFTALTTTVRDGHTANASPYLNLADTEHGFGGQADDGVMFFGGQLNDNSYRYYAGIYSSTDLGAPLTDVSQNGVWRAWIRTSGKDPENEAFTLTVDFNATTAMGTLKAFFQSTLQSTAGDGLYYNIDGRFGINGVITGNVAIGTAPADTFVESGDEYTLGVLTGLIGADGVVAAFVSNTSTITTDGGINPFVGGFVGIPALADHDVFSHHYKTQLNTDLTTGDVAFATGSAVGLDATGLTFDAANQFTSFPVVEEGDGFALMFGQTTGAENRYRAGLLSGTDLGKPLSGNEPNANWTGSVYVSSHLNGTTNVPMEVDLTLAVNFSAGTIGVSNQTITGDKTLTIVGRFGAGDATLPVGILGGTVSYNDGTTEHTSLPLIGLIGVDGAIGVFHGGDAIPMVGGFAVKP